MLRRCVQSAGRWRLMPLLRPITHVAHVPEMGMLRSGFETRDLEQVWEAWTSLRSQQQLHLLRRNDFADLLALVRANLVHTPIGTRRKAAWKERCIEWGLHAAERRDLFGVLGWMRIELLCDDADGAIQLFDAYFDARKRARVPANDSVHILDAGQAKEPVRDTLEMLILAHAMKHDLAGLVRTMQSFDVGTHTELFFDMAHARRQYTKLLRLLHGTDTTATELAAQVYERAFDWISHAELARGLLGGCGGRAGPNRIARLLGSLLARGDVTNAWRLYSTAKAAGIASTAEASGWLAVEQLAQPGQLGAWTDSAWVVCLGGFLSAGRLDLAAHVWRDIVGMRQRMPEAWPPMAVWNAMLDGYARSGRYDLASKTWRVLCGKARPEHLPLALETSQMLPVPSHGPDAVCYTTMIAATFRERRADEGMNLYHALRAKEARQELHVPVETYNAVLHGLCLTHHLDKAYALLRSMGQNGVPSPSITTINVLLRAQARQKQLHAMADTLRCIAPLGLHPDVVTFTTVLDALLRTSTSPAMAQQAVQQVMQLMQSMDVQPNSVTLTSMIKACLHTKDDVPPRIGVALQLMHTMCTNLKVAPTAITFETLILGLVPFSSRLDREAYELPPSLSQPWPPLWPNEAPPQEPLPAVTRLVLLLWHMMVQQHITPTPDTYRSLVRLLMAPQAPMFCFRRGVCIADALLHAHGALLRHAQAPAGVMPPASPPALASWTAVLKALMRPNPAVDAEVRRQVLEAVLQHFRTSPHGAKMYLNTSQDRHAHLARIVQLAEHSIE